MYGMPELCRFHGLVITMYLKDHGVPHFHVTYAEFEATIEIESGRLHGTLPRRALILALEWSLMHRAELLENWRRARRGAPLNRIDPLE